MLFTIDKIKIKGKKIIMESGIKSRNTLQVCWEILQPLSPLQREANEVFNTGIPFPDVTGGDGLGTDTNEKPRAKIRMLLRKTKCPGQLPGLPKEMREGISEA